MRLINKLGSKGALSLRRIKYCMYFSRTYIIFCSGRAEKQREEPKNTVLSKARCGLRWSELVRSQRPVSIRRDYLVCGTFSVRTTVFRLIGYCYGKWAITTILISIFGYSFYFHTTLADTRHLFRMHSNIRIDRIDWNNAQRIGNHFERRLIVWF